MLTPNIEIKIADREDLVDLSICVDDFLDFIESFKTKFLNKELLILKIYYNSILAGVLVAEDKSHEVDSLEKIIPNFYIHLVYINPKFRNKDLGKTLLKLFIKNQKDKGTASIYTKLPKKYKKGITFFRENDFQQISCENNEVILVLNLWKDYGIRDCMMIGDYSNDIFS
ncbi:MAG: GNAT family N-acetyltransferase [Candidatus Hermodarchaeota archaeon]